MKTLLCLFSFILLSAQAHAENRFGVVAGVNLAKLSGNGAVSQSFGDKTGFIEGLTYQHGLGAGLYLETFLRYIQKGGMLDATTKTTLGYLNIPVYAKYKMNDGAFFKPFVFGGPSFGIKTDAKIGNVKGARSREQFKAFDFSVDAGLGFDLAMSESIELSLSGAYNLGLINAATGTREAALAGRAIKNQGINIFASATWKL